MVLATVAVLAAVAKVKVEVSQVNGMGKFPVSATNPTMEVTNLPISVNTI